MSEPDRGRPTPDTTTRPSPERLAEAIDLLAGANAEATYRAMLSLVRTGHDEILQTLPFNPSLEFHDPRCVKVDPEPQGLDTIALYARAAFPHFDRVLLDPIDDSRYDHLLNHLQSLLFVENANVAVVTNHGQVIDIALVMAALYMSLCREDRTFSVLDRSVDLADLAPRSNVLVSRMVTTRQALGVPAMQVLQVATRTFLTIPQTASRRRARLDRELVRANNVVMRHELDQQLAEGGQILLMAASGSQDVTLAAGLIQRARESWLHRRGEEPPENGTLHLQPLYDGTMTLMETCDYVLPIAMSLDPGAPCCVLGQMTKITERDDCHRVMEWIAAAHEDETGIPTVYHWHEDDLLTQVRVIAESLRR